MPLPQYKIQTLLCSHPPRNPYVTECLILRTDWQTGSPVEKDTEGDIGTSERIRRIQKVTQPGVVQLHREAKKRRT